MFISTVDISTNLKNFDIAINIDKESLANIDIDIDKEILENIDIDIDKKSLENIYICKEILENIDIAKISNWLEFGISNSPISMVMVTLKTIESLVAKKCAKGPTTHNNQL